MTVSPSPDLCTGWTPERVIDYSHMVDAAAYPEVAQMVVEWNETCAANAALVDKPWEITIIDNSPCVGGRLTCWWRSLWSE